MKANFLYHLGLGASILTTIGIVLSGLAYIGDLNTSMVIDDGCDLVLLWPTGILTIISIVGICLYIARKPAGLIICSGVMLTLVFSALLTTFFVTAVGQPSISEILPMAALVIALLLMVWVMMKKEVRTIFFSDSKWNLAGVMMASTGTAIIIVIAMLVFII